MEDTINEPTPKLRHTIGFSRKIQPAKFQGKEASLFLQFEMDADAGIDEVIAHAEGLYAIAQATVYEQLGVPYEIDPDTGEVTEDTTSVAAAAAAIEAAFEDDNAPAPRRAVEGDVPPYPPYEGERLSKDERAENEVWAKARYAVAPDEFYDNRAKKRSGEYKSTSPDLKHKETGTPIWKAPRG